MRTIGCTLALLVLATGLSASQEDEDLRNLPGYLDFSALKGLPPSAESVEVYIKDPILSLVAALSKKEDPALAELLSGLKLIRVEAYTLNGSPGQTELITKALDQIRQALERHGWDIVVRAREEKEQVGVYMKSAEGKINGLAILAFEAQGELALVNIVGDIDLDSIAKLGGKFGVPALDSLKTDETPEQGGTQ